MSENHQDYRFLNSWGWNVCSGLVCARVCVCVCVCVIAKVLSVWMCDRYTSTPEKTVERGKQMETMETTNALVRAENQCCTVCMCVCVCVCVHMFECICNIQMCSVQYIVQFRISTAQE